MEVQELFFEGEIGQAADGSSGERSVVAPSENYDPPPLYDVEHLALSTKGRGYLVNNFVYLRDKGRPGRVYIRCQERKRCQARAVVFPEMNKARLMPVQHTHGPPRITQCEGKILVDHSPRPASRSRNSPRHRGGMRTRTADANTASIETNSFPNIAAGCINPPDLNAGEYEGSVTTNEHEMEAYRGTEDCAVGFGPSTSVGNEPNIAIVGHTRSDVIQNRRGEHGGKCEVFVAGPVMGGSRDEYTEQQHTGTNTQDQGPSTSSRSHHSYAVVGVIGDGVNHVKEEPFDSDYKEMGGTPTGVSAGGSSYCHSDPLGFREPEERQGPTADGYRVATVECYGDGVDGDGFILEEEPTNQGSSTTSHDRSESHRVSSTSRDFQRTRSINAPIPAPSFGPKACLKKVPPSQMMHVTDPSSQKLIWNESPLTVLVIKKMMDESILEPFKTMTRYLLEEKNLVVYVEAKVLDEGELHDDKEFDKYRLKMKTFTEGNQLMNKIDFIVCLGGDGTLLYASSLFQEGTVPPVIAFHLGSFGFLTTFAFEEFQEAINILLQGNTPVTLRSRLKCLIFKDHDIPSDLDRENVIAIKPKKLPDPPNLEFKYECLNEVVIDRGPSPYLSNLDLFLDDKHITTVQGDGLIISTPTGSTAYAAAAGASMIHPNVPAILITPICPHTLSFRPIVVPAGVELKITVSPDARHTAWVSLDGKHRQEIHKGWCLRITNSVFPVASVCSVDQVVDWFDSLRACMHWNEREQQKSFQPRERLRKGPSNNNLKKLSQNGESSVQNRT